MRRVFKYELDRLATTVELPEGAQALTARYQDSEHGQGFMLWVLVDPDAEKELVPCAVVPTGGIVPDNMRYLATIEKPSGSIYHVFIR